MNNIFFRLGIRFVLLVLLQVFIINDVDFYGYVDPYIYILFIITYPLDRNLLMFFVVSFMLGLSIDILSNSGGIHATSSLLVASLRRPIYWVIIGAAQDKAQDNIMENMNYRKFISIMTIMVLIHHFCIFFLAIFSITHFTDMLFRTIFSSAITALILSILGLFSSESTLFVRSK